MLWVDQTEWVSRCVDAGKVVRLGERADGRPAADREVLLVKGETAAVPEDGH